MNKLMRLICGIPRIQLYEITNNGFEYDFAKHITTFSKTKTDITRINIFQIAVRNYAASREFLKQYQVDKHKNDNLYSHYLMWHDIYPSIERSCKQHVKENLRCIFGFHKHVTVDESSIMLVCRHCGHAKIDYELLSGT